VGVREARQSVGTLAQFFAVIVAVLAAGVGSFASSVYNEGAIPVDFAVRAPSPTPSRPLFQCCPPASLVVLCRRINPSHEHLPDPAPLRGGRCRSWSIRALCLAAALCLTTKPGR
jgi:hypothetical protein